MADYLTTDTELTSIANAIRTKGGTSASLTYPAGFVSAIENIPSGDDGSLKAIIERTATTPTLPDDLTKIGACAFQYCNKLEITSLPEGVTLIDQSAFEYCSKLASMTLPSSLSSIGNYAFRYCSSLKTISCTGRVTTLGTGAFNGQTITPSSLESFSFPNMSMSNLGTVFGSTTASQACQKLEFADIGTTSKIAANAFANCYKLQTLVLRKTADICTLANVSAFLNTPMRGYNSLTGTVYVPNALKSTYQTATNWKTLYDGGTLTFAAIEGSQYEL